MNLGHTLLHELTHLDAVGRAAGLTADGDGLYGTFDPQTGCELLGARDYLTAWEDDKNDQLASPDYNAESLAAVATGTSLSFPSQAHQQAN
jgi:hypothetical protein